LSHLQIKKEEISKAAIAVAQTIDVSIPVRLSDYHLIRKAIPVGSYEFHLSYKEVESDLLTFEVDSKDSFSVHLPDYINSTTLIDPFSSDDEIRELSLNCVEKVVEFSSMLSEKTSRRVPIVASLAGVGIERSEFYPKVVKLFSEYSSTKTALTLQWLPPFAWYFGGSVKLTNMCESRDVEYILNNGIPVTLDTSHLILGKNHYKFDALRIIQDLLPVIQHWHISDAVGSDGEGIQLGDGGDESQEVLKLALKQQGLKVIEVWQGHFNSFQGFKTAINRIPKLMRDPEN
jgi:N-acetylneuraminate synthase